MVSRLTRLATTLCNHIGGVVPSLHVETTPYRSDIDGLRAISILLVVSYHARPALVPGGFVGVDIFFVISGFLITRIIVTEAKEGRFSPLSFYARRVRRIFPALAVVLLTTWLIGWLVLLPDGFALLGKNIAAGVGFVSNLFQLTHTGYFAPDSADNPLLHLWSLGIEEQFYIVWPMALLLLKRASSRRFWIIVAAAVSFGTSLLIFAGYKEWAFYAPLPRAWELLLGAIIADSVASGPEGFKSRFAGHHDAMAVTGTALIVGAAFGLSSESVFPGMFALMPTFGAALIILSPEAGINRLLLSAEPAVFLGLISYPLYLWHWPLLSYLGILRNGVPNDLEIGLAMIIAVLLSWLTFRFIEMPLRRRPNVVPKLAAALLVLGVLGVATVEGAGFDFRFDPAIRQIASIPQQNNSGLRDRCFLKAAGAKFESDCIEEGKGPLLVLWGDSTAAALYAGLKQAQETHPFRLGRFTAPGCPPLLVATSRTACDKDNALAYGLIKQARPEIVLIHAQWDAVRDLDQLGATIRQLKAANVPRIVILGPVPVWKRTLPHAMVNYYRLHHAIPDRIASGVSGPESDRRIEVFGKQAGVEFISARDVLCDALGCLTRIGPGADDVVTSDIIHLSERGSKFLIDAIADRLLSPSIAR